MEHRGRPVAGAVAGFAFGGFLGLTLMLFGVFTVEGPWLALAPIGLVLGAMWGWWAPIGRRRYRDTPPSLAVPIDTSGTTTQTWTVRPITGEVPIVPQPRPVPRPTPPAGLPPVAPPPARPRPAHGEDEEDDENGQPWLRWADEPRPGPPDLS